jgi:hypothetical protein
VRRTGREIEFRSRCRDDGRKSKSHFNIYNLLSQLQHIYPHICCVILQLKFDLCQFLSGIATIITEFSSGLKFPPISNGAATKGTERSVRKIPIIDLSTTDTCKLG